jgi:hypothetical protein
MSERAPQHHEQHEQEKAPYGEHHPKPEQSASVQHESTPNKQETIDHLLKKIEKEARSTHELAKAPEITSSHEHAAPGHVGTHLKSHGHGSRHTLRSVQKELKGPERAFSKFIHNEAVDNISAVAGATVARPTGLLLGGVFSVIASIAVLVICRFYGYEYNYTIGLLSFVGGFFFGNVVELLARLIRR